MFICVKILKQFYKTFWPFIIFFNDKKSSFFARHLHDCIPLYYYYTIWMSLDTGLFFLVLLLNQR